MLYTLLGIEYAFIAYTLIAGALGRGLKALWSTMPPKVLPWTVLVSGYLVVFVDQLAGGSAAAHAAFFALWGVLSGWLAVGGHELLKGALVLVPKVDEDKATKLLGQLEKTAAEKGRAPKGKPLDDGGRDGVSP